MMNPRFPVYIPSKSRANNGMTARYLERAGVDYQLVIEGEQRDAYEKYFPEKRLLILDPQFQKDYETCDDLGMSKPVGAGAARNFAWEHARAAGFSHHWVMDDNIRLFYWLNNNKKTHAADGSLFHAMETFMLRYMNLAMCGPEYAMFAPARGKVPPFRMNTRVFSCNLIRNDIEQRWRGRYNEDLILSLDVLKAGWATTVFYAFLQDKIGTQLMKGGNTDVLYAAGTLEKSQMAVNTHPDVVRHVFRYGRNHHHADFSQWKNRGLVRAEGSDDKQSYVIRPVARPAGKRRTRGTVMRDQETVAQQ